MPSLRSEGLFRLAAAALRPRSKGALPPSALRLPPPRSPRGRGAGHTAFGLLSRTHAGALGSLRGVKGAAAPSILTRSVLAPLGLRSAAASGAALDPTPLGCRSWPPVLLERNQGQDLMGGTRPKGGGATVHS